MISYPGGKNGSGVYQKIISLMPKHEHYVELFLGSGAILRNKKPAVKNFGIDVDSKVFEFWKDFDCSGFSLRNEHYLNFINNPELWLSSNPENTLIYADPPYLQSVRKSKGKIYNCELMKESEHIELLNKLKALPCKIMVSGYESKLYDDLLTNWRKVSFQTTNRAHQKTTETVWLNFTEPVELHDYRFLGENFRERERIKRKKERWKQRLLRMDNHEKFALLATIDELKQSSTTSP